MSAIPETVVPLRFEPGFEHPAPDEAETQETIAQQMDRIQRKTYEDGGRPLRSVHAKSHGILVGELVVEPGLAPAYAQGISAVACRRPIVLRFSTIPGDVLPDNVSTPRGLAIKVIGVEGERLAGSTGDVTQDFLLVNGPAFQFPDARRFASSLKMLAGTTDRAEGTKQVLSAVLRGVEKVVEAVGGQSATLTSLGGHPETHPLGETYYSQVPILWGDYFGKVCVRPVTPQLQALEHAPIDLASRPDGLREEIASYFARAGGEWELCVQLCTDIEAMPVEDASKPWDEARSPYVAVARLIVPSQPSWDADRSRTADDRLAFSPWHGIAAHRPLGSVMRLRRKAYADAQGFRAERLPERAGEPQSLQELGL